MFQTVLQDLFFGLKSLQSILDQKRVQSHTKQRQMYTAISSSLMRNYNSP